MSNIAYADFGGKIADLTEHEYLLEDGAVNVQKVNTLSGALVLPMMDSWADGNDPRMLYDRFQTWLDNGQYVGIYLYLQKIFEDSLLDLPPESFCNKGHNHCRNKAQNMPMPAVRRAYQQHPRLSNTANSRQSIAVKGIQLAVSQTKISLPLLRKTIFRK